MNSFSTTNETTLSGLRVLVSGGTTADAAKTEDIDRVFKESDKALDGLDVYISNAALCAEAL